MERRTLLVGTVAVAALPSVGHAAEPGRNDAQMKDDWPWLGRYAADNAAVKAAGTKVKIVFMGDSISEGWVRTRPAFFRSGWIGRGISGQTTPQMVLRMMADVVVHKPRFIHILGGTNDVAQNTGPIDPEASVANIRMMVDIARQEKLNVLIGAIPPAADFSWRRGLEPASKIVALNAMLKELALEMRSYWIDYHTVLSDGKGGMNPAFSGDGVHPNAEGYAAMEKLFARSVPHHLVQSE